MGGGDGRAWGLGETGGVDLLGGVLHGEQLHVSGSKGMLDSSGVGQLLSSTHAL